MILLTCPKCRFSMKLPEHRVSGRPLCPSCSQGLMEMTEREQERVAGGWRRKKTAPVVRFAPGVIRNLVFGCLLLLAGPGLIIVAISWPARASTVSAVFIGHGGVLTVWGIVLLVRAAMRKSD